jgi:hypothetical protein
LKDTQWPFFCAKGKCFAISLQSNLRNATHIKEGCSARQATQQAVNMHRAIITIKTGMLADQLVVELRHEQVVPLLPPAPV